MAANGILKITCPCCEKEIAIDADTVDMDCACGAWLDTTDGEVRWMDRRDTRVSLLARLGKPDWMAE